MCKSYKQNYCGQLLPNKITRKKVGNLEKISSIGQAVPVKTVIKNTKKTIINLAFELRLCDNTLPDNIHEF